MLGERTSQLVPFEMQKLMTAAVLLSPYLPMLFMGEEWSEPNPFLYFVSHTDPALAEAVRKGRRAEFAAFHLEGEAPDPMSEDSFNRSKLQWDLAADGKHKAMLAYYKALIQLRKTNPVLQQPDRKNLTATANPDAQTLLLQRWKGANKISCLLNFSREPAVLNLDKAREWKTLLNSAETRWNGPGDAVITENSIRLHPQSILVLEQ